MKISGGGNVIKEDLEGQTKEIGRMMKKKNILMEF